MQVLFLVLNKVEYLEKLLSQLAKAGIKGATIVESTGMAHVLGDSEDANILGSLRMLFEPHREESKTIFFVLEQQQIAIVKKVVNEVIGSLNKPNTGIMFGVDLAFVEGISLPPAEEV